MWKLKETEKLEEPYGMHSTADSDEVVGGSVNIERRQAPGF